MLAASWQAWSWAYVEINKTPLIFNFYVGLYGSDLLIALFVLPRLRNKE